MMSKTMELVGPAGEVVGGSSETGRRKGEWREGDCLMVLARCSSLTRRGVCFAGVEGSF